MLTLGMRNVTGLIATLALGLLTGCPGEGALCDGGQARAALDRASPGATVRLGSCRVEGPLRVPAGVALIGTEGTVVVGPEGTAAVFLSTGRAPGTRLEGLTVEAGGVVGVLARGTGDATIERVSIVATRGIGLGAAEVDGLSLDEVTITGPVTPENAASPMFLRVVGVPPSAGPCPADTTCDCEPGQVREGDGSVCDSVGRWATLTAAYGLYLEDVTATLTGVDVRGFASFGAVLRESAVTWSGGSVGDNLGIGLRQMGGTLDASDVDVTTTFEGLRGIPAYAVAATDGARLSSSRMMISDNERYGMLVLGAGGSHEHLLAERNGDAALWVGDSDDFQLTGEESSFCENAFAGIVVVDSQNVEIRDATIERTRPVGRLIGELGMIRIGDGVHVGNSLADVAFAGLSLLQNGRAGVVVDLGAGSGEGISFSGVTVDGTGDQLGAIGGTTDGDGRLIPVASGEWDMGITRLGDTAENDLGATIPIDAISVQVPGAISTPAERVGVIMPMF